MIKESCSNLQTRIWGLHRKRKIFHFRLLPVKLNDKIFHELKKNLFLAHFGPISLIVGKIQIFPKNQFLSLLSLYGYLISCTRSRENNELMSGFQEKETNGRTNRRMDRLELIEPCPKAVVQ